VPLLDDLLALLGTNRTRVQWKLRAWRRGWDRRVASIKNRSQALTYAHQTCPRCNHPADAADKVCSRCGEALGGRLAHQARRAAALVWAPNLPFVATVLVAAIAGMYVTSVMWGPRVGLAGAGWIGPHAMALYRFGSLSTVAVEHGEWWRLSTSMFLHVHVLHLVFNVMSLCAVAIYLEEVLGKAKTFALFIALGMIASITSFVWHANTGAMIGNSAGASGAICGLIGVCVGFSLRRRNIARHQVGHYVGWVVWIAILGMSGWNIDNAGHFGGLIPGVLVGLVVRRRADTGGRARRAWTIAAVACAAFAIATIVIVAGHPLPDATLDAVRAARGE
jgi:rhomboid protease GluP